VRAVKPHEGEVVFMVGDAFMLLVLSLSRNCVQILVGNRTGRDQFVDIVMDDKRKILSWIFKKINWEGGKWIEEVLWLAGDDGNEPSDNLASTVENARNMCHVIIN
jgi:hypothetical protein